MKGFSIIPIYGTKFLKSILFQPTCLHFHVPTLPKAAYKAACTIPSHLLVIRLTVTCKINLMIMFRIPYCITKLPIKVQYVLSFDLPKC